MNVFYQKIQELDSSWKLIISSLLLLIVFILDYISGNEIGFSIFYLFPVALATWSFGKSAGIIFSIASAILWFIADFMGGSIHSPLIVAWNSIVRLGFFLIVTFMISKSNEQKKTEEELMHFLIHDLRAPLSNILGSLEFLKEESKEQQIDKDELLDLSVVSGKKMMLFINSFLDLGRLQSKRMPVNKTEVNVDELSQAAINQTRIIAIEKNIRVKTFLSVKEIFADEFLLLRILSNLLNNAIKVSPKNSEIIIETKEINNSFVEFQIRDFGPGLKKGMENKLFNKYTQLDYRKKGTLTGSGLGLTFCKAAVEAQGGNIRMESQENKGTTVFFILPKNGKGK
jgi:signal transduction histidine kinase